MVGNIGWCVRGGFVTSIGSASVRYWQRFYLAFMLCFSAGNGVGLKRLRYPVWGGIGRDALSPPFCCPFNAFCYAMSFLCQHFVFWVCCIMPLSYIHLCCRAFSGRKAFFIYLKRRLGSFFLVSRKKKSILYIIPYYPNMWTTLWMGESVELSIKPFSFNYKKNVYDLKSLILEIFAWVYRADVVLSGYPVMERLAPIQEIYLCQ